MAEYLNAAMLRTGAGAGVLVALCAFHCVAAEDLVDPTRPPAGLGKFQADVASAGPVLQSILISPTRRIAIISGKAVKAGEKYGDAQVVAIGENEVVLKTGKSQQVLKLYPSLHNPVPISRSGSNLDNPGQPR